MYCWKIWSGFLLVALDSEGSVVFRVGNLTFNLPDQTRNPTMDLWYVTGLGLEGQWLEDSMQQIKGLWILSFARYE
jgi:hypothetical protein